MKIKHLDGTVIEVSGHLPWSGRCKVVAFDQGHEAVDARDETYPDDIRFYVECTEESPEPGRQYVCYADRRGATAVVHSNNTTN